MKRRLVSSLRERRTAAGVLAGVAAVQEKADSPVATLGYSYTAAIGHILLTTWGTVIVLLMS
jgi:putative transport protein